ncbi:glutamate receptor 3.7-like protein, partial [Tanacetum coccineum]
MESKLLLLLLLSIQVFVTSSSKRPDVVNVGALFSFDSVIGKAAKIAMEEAVVDVNNDFNILNGTKMKLIMYDTDCSVFRSSIG